MPSWARPPEKKVGSAAKIIDAVLAVPILTGVLIWCLLMISIFGKRRLRSQQTTKRFLLCLVPTTLEDLESKGTADAIKYRDLDGYFEHVYTIHFPARKDRVILFAERHTIYEFSQHHFSSLRQFPMTNLIASEVRLLSSLAHLIRQQDISVIRAQDPYVQGLNAFFLSKTTGIPFIISVHSNYDLTRESTGMLAYRFLRFHRIEKVIERFVFRHADFVIAISDDNRNFAIRNGANPNRTATVRIPALPIHYDKAPRRNLKPQLGIRRHKMVVYVGRLSPENYPYDLINCARHVANIRGDVVFVLVGDGPVRGEIQRLASSIGVSQVLKIQGFQPQERVREFLHTADVIVSPGPGNRALIEALLSGKPVVAYDVECHRELIQNRFNGLVIPYRDEAAMAEAVLWILNHPREAGRLGRNARSTAMQQFGVKKLHETETACFDFVLS